jgi:TrmH family RNA methyltransferase
MRSIDLRVVLVRSLYERNVGATSRAMANMGFSKLILIDPQCEFTIESNKAAASGQAALRDKVIYKNWDEFYQNEPRGIQIATTARDGRGRQTEDLEKTLRILKDTHPEFAKKIEEPIIIHLLFGREDHGLEADDLKYANFCCCLPTYGQNPSLNLAQATLLALFVVRHVYGGERTVLDGQQKPRAAQKKSENIFPDETLKAWLSEMNMDLSRKRINVYTVLRRMLLQNVPSAKEFRMLEIVLQQSTRRMREGRKTKV